MESQKSRHFRELAGLGAALAMWLLITGTSEAFPLSLPKVGAGGSHSCAVVDGGVRCWGSNDYGELGAPTFGDVDMATDVRTLEPGTNAGVTAVAVGEHHSCAIVNGAMKCWGRNNFGQLGVGDTQDRRLPVTVPNLSNVTFIAAGGGHTCAIFSDANVTNGMKCWGDN